MSVEALLSQSNLTSCSPVAWGQAQMGLPPLPVSRLCVRASHPQGSAGDRGWHGMTETTLEASEGRVQSRSEAGQGQPRWGSRPSPWSAAPGAGPGVRDPGTHHADSRLLFKCWKSL